MRSGKSTAMLAEIERYNIVKMKTLVVKFRGDTRFTDSPTTIMTHGHREYSSEKNGQVVAAESLDELMELELATKFDAIAIDEFQFFQHPEAAQIWADGGVDVFIAALDGDYNSQMFENVTMMIPYANEVVKLSAICEQCHKMDAPLTRRTSNSHERILIGDAMYVTLCRRCDNNLVL